MEKFEILPFRYRMLIFFYCAAVSCFIVLCGGVAILLADHYLSEGIGWTVLPLVFIGVIFMYVYIFPLTLMYFRQNEKRPTTVREKIAFYLIPSVAGIIAGISLAKFVLFKMVL